MIVDIAVEVSLRDSLPELSKKIPLSKVKEALETLLEDSAYMIFTKDIDAGTLRFDVLNVSEAISKFHPEMKVETVVTGRTAHKKPVCKEIKKRR